MRMLKMLASLAMAGVLGVILLLGFLWLERRAELTLPAPSGTFAVGRQIFDWTDANAMDALAPKAGTRREVLVWIWYPAQRDASATVAEYWPAELKAAAPSAVRQTLLGS